MSLFIRPLKDSDYRKVKEIFIDNFKDRIPIRDIGISFDKRDAQRSMGYYETEDSSEMIGFHIMSTNTRNKGNVYLDYIAISPRYQRCGYGTQMMWRIVRDTFRDNESIHLYPFDERLARWYRKFGFYHTHDGYLNFHSYHTRSYRDRIDYKKVRFTVSRLERCRRWCFRTFRGLF